MTIVSTLKKEGIQKQPRKEKNRKIKINFDSVCSEIVEKLIDYNKPNYSIAIQALPAKEIQAIIQRNFSILEFEVSEIEVLTSERLARKFGPGRYNKEPENDKTKSFLDDMLSNEDIIVDEENKKSWSKTKVKVSINKSSMFYTSDKEYSIGNTPKGIKIKIKKDGRDILERPLFTIPGVKIDSCTKNIPYKNIAIGGKYKCLERYESSDYAKDNIYKVLDLNYIVAICKLLESCYKYIDRDTSFLYNSKNSYYGLEYTIEDFNNLIDVSFLANHKTALNKKIESLICECSIAVTHVQSSEILMESYEREIDNEYSKSFETKKNIPQKIKAVMKNNNFLESFNMVELDETVDIEKFYMIENEFMLAKEKLNLDRFINKNGELRFKRLGQHRANGLYYPHSKCICVDLNNPSSFMHQIGLFIDNSICQNGNASSNPDFRLIAVEFKKELEKEANTLSESEDDKKIVNSYKRKRAYYHTPTEIFARSFEMYLIISKNMTSSLLPTAEILCLENGYPRPSERLMTRVTEYFNEIFNIENNINTTISNAEAMLISFNEVATTIEPRNITEIIQEDNIEDNNEPNNNTVDSNVICSDIEPAHDGDGANFIFKIIQDATANESGARYKTRRRPKLNRKPLDEDATASQIAFF